MLAEMWTANTMLLNTNNLSSWVQGFAPELGNTGSVAGVQAGGMASFLAGAIRLFGNGGKVDDQVIADATSGAGSMVAAQTGATNPLLQFLQTAFTQGAGGIAGQMSRETNAAENINTGTQAAVAGVSNGMNAAQNIGSQLITTFGNAVTPTIASNTGMPPAVVTTALNAITNAIV